MLDIEVETDPTETGVDVVSVAELARHIHLSPRLRANTDWTANMTDAINETVDKLHGLDGELNRTILPCTWKLYLTQFPKRGPIYLPYPNLISVDAITIEDGSSPANVVDDSDYVVKSCLVPEIYPTSTWPTVTFAPRAISITYQAGYETYPLKLKRLVKILAAHYLENPEATINEPRQMQINRKVEFGVESLRAALTVPVSYDDWNC